MNWQNKSAAIFTIITSLVFVVFSILTPIQTVYAVSDTDDGFETFFSKNEIIQYDPRAMQCGANPTPIGGGEAGSVNTASVPGTFTLGTDNALRAVTLAKQMMADFSLTQAQAAGIVGNFMHESGGRHVPPDINEDTSTPAPPAFEGGYGWAQWTGSRQLTFIDYAIKNGYMESKANHATDAANYAYLKYELTKTETSTIPAVQATSTAEDAARAFEARFERAGTPLMEMRIKYANELFNALVNGGGINASGTTNAPTSAATAANCVVTAPGIPTGGQIFSTVVFPLTVKQPDVKNNYIFHDGSTDRAGHPYIAFDILANAGTQVVALTNGRVTSVNLTGSMGGNVTVYNDEKKLHVYYTHMEPSTSLSVGQTITPGQALGVLTSVKKYPLINADHLHIDAGTGERRLSCSRSNPSGPACNTRVDIGPDLFKGWETLAP